MEPEQQSENFQNTPAYAAPVANSASQNILIPLAIVFGFGLVAAAIFFSGGIGGTQVPSVAVNDTAPAAQPNQGDPDNVTPVSEDDWIRGNPNAPIQIVEYSDFDCPFCKNFHETMNQIMAEYGTTGQVAWVYRHFPLEQLHPNAARIAVASECAGHLGGNEAFWNFSDLVFGERATNEPTNLSRLEEFAVSSGVDATAFNNCVANDEYLADVEADFQNAIAVGGRGTPHSIVVVGDQTGVINGAQPYGAVRQTIENLLAQLEGSAQ